MAELVQQDGAEQQHDEEHIANGRVAAILPQRAGADPDQKQEEGDVDTHRRTRDAAQSFGPGHAKLTAYPLDTGHSLSGKSFAPKEAPGLENFGRPTRYLVSQSGGGRRP